MRHVKRIIFAILVAGCLPELEGLSVAKEYEDQEEPNKYLDYAKSFVSRGGQLVGSGLLAGAGMVGRGIVSGVGAGTQYALDKLSNSLSSVDDESLTSALGLPDDLSELDMYEVLPNLIMAQAQSCKGGVNYETAVIFLERLSVMVPSLKTTAEAFQAVSYVINEIRQQLIDESPIDSTALMAEAVHMYFDDGNDSMREKLIDMSPLVFDAAFGDTDAAWAIAYALVDRNTFSKGLKRTGCDSQTEAIKAIITQVSTYTKLVKTAHDDESFASLGAGTIGTGIVRGLGAATEYTLDAMSKAYSSVTTQSLTGALGLPADPSKTLSEKVDFPQMLERVITAQTKPGNSVVNYGTALVFLERLSILVPLLKKPVNALQTVSYVMNKIQNHKTEGKKIDARDIMKEAVDVYFMDVDKDFKKKLVNLSPQISAAALGDKDAASKVAEELADRETIRQALNAMGYKQHVEIARKVVEQVSTYARLVRTAYQAFTAVKYFMS